MAKENETNAEQVVSCPHEPLIKVPVSCTKKCAKCSIAATGGLYDSMGFLNWSIIAAI